MLFLLIQYFSKRKQATCYTAHIDVCVTTGLFDFQSSEDKEELRVSYRKENEGKSFCQLEFILYHSCVYLKMEAFP